MIHAKKTLRGTSEARVRPAASPVVVLIAATAILATAVLISSCSSSGAGGSDGDGGTADFGGDLVNTLWVGEDQVVYDQDDLGNDLYGDVVMSIREHGKVVWLVYDEWTETNPELVQGSCSFVTFLSATELQSAVVAIFETGDGGGWRAAEADDQPANPQSYTRSGDTMTFSAPESAFSVQKSADGLSDPLLGTSWKRVDLADSGRAVSAVFRADGTVEYLQYDESQQDGPPVQGGRGTYFLLDDGQEGEFLYAIGEFRNGLASDWVSAPDDETIDPDVGTNTYSFSGTNLTVDSDLMYPTESDGNLVGNAWYAKDLDLLDAPPVDVLIFPHTNGSYGYTVYDELPENPNLWPQGPIDWMEGPFMLEGSCGTWEQLSETSSTYEVYASAVQGDWQSDTDLGQSPTAHLEDLYIEQLPDGGDVIVAEYIDAGDLNPMAGTSWPGTATDNSDDSADADASLSFTEAGDLQFLFSFDGTPFEGGRGRYFVVAPGNMVFWQNEYYDPDSGSWLPGTGPEDNDGPITAWGIWFDISGDFIWAVDYEGSVSVVAQRLP